MEPDDRTDRPPVAGESDVIRLQARRLLAFSGILDLLDRESDGLVRAQDDEVPKDESRVGNVQVGAFTDRLLQAVRQMF